MGVKLQGIITRKQVSIPNLAGKVIAIDAPNIIMQVIGYIRPNSEGIMIDRTQRAISHL